MASSFRPVSRVVLLSGCGFTGLNIIKTLLHQGCSVLCLDRASMPLAASTVFEALPNQSTPVPFDVRTPSGLAELLAGRNSLLLGAAIHALYNHTGASRRVLLRWGQAVAAGLGNGSRCALAGDVAANIDLHAAADRPPLDKSRLAAELGWQARHGLTESANQFIHWWQKKGTFLVGTA